MFDHVCTCFYPVRISPSFVFAALVVRSGVWSEHLWPLACARVCRSCLRLLALHLRLTKVLAKSQLTKKLHDDLPWEFWYLWNFFAPLVFVCAASVWFCMYIFIGMYMRIFCPCFHAHMPIQSYTKNVQNATTWIHDFWAKLQPRRCSQVRSHFWQSSMARS